MDPVGISWFSSCHYHKRVELSTYLPMRFKSSRKYVVFGLYAQAEVLSPVKGQNLPPPDLTRVTVDAYFDTVQLHQTEENSYTAVVWLHLRWTDTRAENATLEATKNWMTGTKTCARTCDASGKILAGCCETVW